MNKKDTVLKVLEMKNTHYEHVEEYIADTPPTNTDIRSFIIAESNLAIAIEIARLSAVLSALGRE